MIRRPSNRLNSGQVVGRPGGRDDILGGQLFSLRVPYGCPRILLQDGVIKSLVGTWPRVVVRQGSQGLPSCSLDVTLRRGIGGVNLISLR